MDNNSYWGNVLGSFLGAFDIELKAIEISRAFANAGINNLADIQRERTRASRLIAKSFGLTLNNIILHAIEEDEKDIPDIESLIKEQEVEE